MQVSTGGYANQTSYTSSTSGGYSISAYTSSDNRVVGSRIG